MQKRTQNMKIYDSKNNLLAEKYTPFSSTKNKEFFTDHYLDFQIASFDLNKGENIERHIHNEQKRLINTTSEVIILVDGHIKFEIYDNDLQHVKNIELKSGEIISLFSGGHALEVLEDSKFIEVKQGPYIEATDKKRF